jgi:APA family basic amino acid/polyamine antiporter
MAEETVVFARKASGLVREMSWLDVMLLVIAGPAASGMTYYAVKQPGIYPGGNMPLAFLIGGLLWVFPVLLIAVYASSFPRSGAMYVVISRATHPLIGFLPMWLWIVSSGMVAGFFCYIGLNLISASLQVGGYISGSQSWIDAGDWLSGNWTRVWIAMILAVILWGLQLMGLDRLKWFIRVIIWVPLIITVVAIVGMFVINGDAAMNDVFGAGTVQKINLAANAQGIQDAILPAGEALLGMMIAVFWAYSALEAVSFVGSEVKSPRTSFMRGMSIGFVAVVVLYVLNCYAPAFSFGSNVIRNYSWLYNTSDETNAALSTALGGVTPPIVSMPFYAGIAFGQAWLCLVFGIAYMCWYLNTALICWLGAVRGLFAMAFDRQLPLWLCKVSKRGVPTAASHVVGVVAVLSVFLGYGDAAGASSAGVMLAILDFTALFFLWTVGLAGIFLPYTRPDLFEKCTFQYKLGGLPWMTILGVLACGIGWWANFMVGVELSTNWSQVGMAAIITIGFALVAWMYARNRKEGIDPNQIFASIPPA